jgi:hypothetical protein
MNRQQQRVMLLFGLLLIGVAMLGCASSNRTAPAARAIPSPYEQDLVRARASLTAAEQAGAAEFGGPQLTLARDKLRAAELAAEQGQEDRAEALAVEADLDADLALAITRNRQTQALATEVQSGLRTLEDELRRTEGTGDGP